MTETILIVDDTPANLVVLVETLGAAGYQLMVAEDGEEALAQTAQTQPDLILLDSVNDGSDREQLAKTIQTDTMLHDTPMLSLSSLKPESEMVSGGILSGYSFFAAPVKVEEVLKGVEQVLFGKD